MSTKKPEEPAEDESRGMLDDAASLDTTSLGIILTHTAQVNVILPQEVDEDLDDEAVVEGEVTDVDLEDVVLEPARVQSIDAKDAVPTEAVTKDAVETDAVETGDVPTDAAVDEADDDEVVGGPTAAELAPASADDDAAAGEVEPDAAEEADEAAEHADAARVGEGPVLESIVIELPAEVIDEDVDDENFEPEPEPEPEPDLEQGSEPASAAVEESAEVPDSDADEDDVDPTAEAGIDQGKKSEREPEPLPEPVAAEQEAVDLEHVEAASVEPASVEPERVEPGRGEPVSVEPVFVEPEQVEPASVVDPESVAPAEPVTEREPLAAPEPVVEPASVAAPELVAPSEPVTEQEPVAASEPRADEQGRATAPDSVPAPDSVTAQDSAEDAEPVDVPERIDAADSADERGTVPVAAPEPVVIASAAVEPIVPVHVELQSETAVAPSEPSAVSTPIPVQNESPAEAPQTEAAQSAPVTSPIRIRSRQSQASASRTPRADAVKEKSTATQPAVPEQTPSARRIGELGDASRESADLLTADRLLDPSRLTKPEPEGAWSHFLYTLSGHRINIGDGRRARERKALTARIAAPLPGGAKFVPVLSRKGGVGKTAITALLGMALADAREDRVIAVDANPDRGTLADRVARGHHTKSIRDLARIHDEVRGYHDISAIVARDATRLDVLASDSDPRIAEAFSDLDYRDVAEVAAQYYSLVLTDTGTGIVHSVMAAALGLADQMVIVSGLSVDEARLASETLTWLETNGFAEQAHDAIVVLNQSTPGTPLVRLNELESHFATRARKVVRMPYDPQIAGGGTIEFAGLQPETRVAARELAALLVEGLRVKVA